MRLIKQSVYLTIDECVECGMNYRTIIDAKDKETKCWSFINDPEDKRRVLVEYEGLKDNYKKMVLERFGNPYDHVAREPILEMVVSDFDAERFFKQYRYELLTGIAGEVKQQFLPIERVYQYTRGAGWLALVSRIMADPTPVIKGLGIILSDFYVHTASLISLEKERGKMRGYAGMDVLPADFPSSYQRLKAKAKAYESEGYGLLIAPEYGNKNASKLGKSPIPTPAEKAGQAPLRVEGGELQGTECAGYLPKGTSEKGMIMHAASNESEGNVAIVSPESDGKHGGFDPELYNKQMAVIRAIATKHNNFDAGQVQEWAEILFTANGWKMVSISTVRKIMQENEALLKAGRRGKRNYDSTVAMQVKRKVTEIPMVYWTLDGWTVELGYKTTGPGKTEYKRLVAVVVLDAWKKYPIGYAIGERETPELIKKANRNALIHVKELFGEVYCPVQVQSDNYQIKNLTPFYQAMAHLHTPAAVGNAKAKVVEPYFKYLNKKYCQRLQNWTGFNLTASQKNQVNTEMANKLKNTYPDKAGCISQIEAIIAHERKKKIAEYRSTWDKLPTERRYTMDVMAWLEVFGVAIGSTNRVTGEGLVKQIDGQKYWFDSFEAEFRRNMHLDWQIYADLNDMSRVLATSPDGKMKFVLEQKREVPMDVMSTTEEDSAYRSLITEFNKRDVKRVTEIYASDAEIVHEVVKDSLLDLDDAQELALKMMFISNGQQKDGLQDAKRLGTAERKQINAARKAERVEVDEWAALQEERLNQLVDFSQYQ